MFHHKKQSSSTQVNETRDTLKNRVKEKEKSEEHKTLKDRAKEKEKIWHKAKSYAARAFLAGSILFSANLTYKIGYEKYINKKTDKVEFKTEAISIPGNFNTNCVVANGLTDKGWWYQFSLQVKGEKITAGYMIWDNKGNVNYPAKGSENIPFNGGVNLNDKFDLKLEIKDGFVTGTVIDIFTNAKAAFRIKAIGNEFIGSKYSLLEGSSDINGFSTSIFREMWVSKSFDTKMITPQIIEIVSPKSIKRNLEVQKNIYKSSYIFERDIYKDFKNSTVYTFDLIPSWSTSKYFRPKTTDETVNNMMIGFDGTFFYTK